MPWRPASGWAALLAGLALSSVARAGPALPLLAFSVATVPPRPVRTVLDNGLRVVCVENPSTQTVALAAFITSTARAETVSQAGLRQFVARVLVDGGAAEDPGLEEALEDLGAETYVGAGVDFTEITLLAGAEDVARAAAVLHDLLLRPRFERASIERLRREVATNLTRSGELPEIAAAWTAAAALYPNHPFGWPVEGLSTSIGGVTPEEVERFYGETYMVNNMLLVVAGGVRAEEGLGAVRAAFAGDLPGRKRPESATPPVPITRQRETVRRPGTVAVWYLGMRSPGVSDPAYPAASVALAVLGSGLGSRMYQVLRRERAIAYTVSAGAVTAREGARAELLVSCPPELVGEAEVRVMREVDELAEAARPAEEIRRAREYICTSYAVGHQRNADVAHTVGAFEVAAEEGCALYEALPRLVREVTPEAVRAAARSMFAAPVVVRVTPS